MLLDSQKEINCSNEQNIPKSDETLDNIAIRKENLNEVQQTNKTAKLLQVSLVLVRKTVDDEPQLVSYVSQGRAFVLLLHVI